MMKLLVTVAFTSSLLAQKSPFEGRWDLDIKTAKDTYPDWMEVSAKGESPAVRIQPRGGAVRTAESAQVNGKKMSVTLSTANGTRPEVVWELTADGDNLTGTEKRGGVADAEIKGVRAPVLKRAEPRSWGPAESLFDGKDLTGWEPVDHPENSHWVAKNGELVNETKGSNLKTTRKFDDFKLHVEFMCPEHCNSGIYLRGRYEVQVGTEGGKIPSHEMGAIYGFTAPAIEMPMGTGEWQTMDITLVGRTVTVVRNGKTIHDHVEIAGITGGALDSREGEPGPFFLQGDHTGGLRFRNIRVQVAKR